MADESKGPASYFPSIEEKYGRAIDEWMNDLEKSGLESHSGMVDWLKSQPGMGHGHASALVGYHRNPGKWPEYKPEG
jgi:hypothetical protein